MALDHADWTIDRGTKVISYIGDDHGGSAPTYATVIQFHRWLQSLADDQIAVAANSDELDITNTDPSRRSTDNIITLINGYVLDETANNATEHLYDGSIIMGGGTIIYDGIVNFGNPDVVIQVIQDGAVIADDWWNLATGFGANASDAAGISHRFMVKTRDDGVDIDGRRLIGTTRVMDTGAGTDHLTFGEFKINGTARGNNVLALTNSDDLNNNTTETIISGWTDITNTEGLNLIDVDADTVNEEYYSKWDTSGSHIQNDYYERLKWLTRDGSVSTIHGINGEAFRGITHNFSFTGTGFDPLVNDRIIWGTYVNVGTVVGGPFTVGEVIWDGLTTVAESTYVGRVLAFDGTDESLILYLEAGVTIGNAAPIEGVSSGTTATTSADPTEVVGGGDLLVLAPDDAGATGELYVQIIKGTAPGTAVTLYESTDLTATLTTSSVSTPRTVSTPFVGVSTGSNIIGAYGIGFETDQINDSDILTALDGFTYSRPNLVTNTVGGLSQVGDDDRVLVATWDTASADVGQGVGYDINGDPVIKKGQMLLSVELTADNETQVTVKTGSETAIPADTPASGSIRVVDDVGYERFIPYSSWTGLVFTIDTGHADIGSNNDFLGNEAAVDNEVYVTYIDDNAATATLNFQVTYTAPRSLVALVRNGDSAAPIKQFIAEWSITTANQTLNAIRTTDI